jgi:hypothetical protein
VPVIPTLVRTLRVHGQRAAGRPKRGPRSRARRLRSLDGTGGPTAGLAVSGQPDQFSLALTQGFAARRPPD